MRLRRSFCASAFLFCLSGLVASQGARGQADFCDPGLPTEERNPHAYRNQPGGHPDRCEGMYVQEVAASDSLRLASFASSLSDFSPETAAAIEIGWGDVPGDSVHLRAQGFGRLYYRMDTELPRDPPFRWSTSVLAALGIEGKDLGILGWTTMNVGGREERVYLPLTVGRSPDAAETGRYQLEIEPAQELEEIYLSVVRADREGEPVEFLRDQEALGYGYYPAATATTIPVKISGSFGLYRVEIVATLDGGGRAATEFWFYHQGR